MHETTDDEKHKETYSGNFENGLRNGTGKYDFLNNDSYEGEWKDDMMNGKGKYIWDKAEWRSDQVTNKKKAFYHQYEGEFMNNERHGKGSLVYADGEVQEGIWDYGFLKKE